MSEFDAIGIHFISLYEGIDISSSNGRLVFGIFASIVEFEHELIRSRVRSGPAATRAKGKRLGRPRVNSDISKIAVLRDAGRSWPEIAKLLNIGVGTAYRAYQNLPKKIPEALSRNLPFMPAVVD